MRELRDERGQALIETAVSVGLFIVLLLGAVEFGRLAFAAIEVTDAAEAVAQYATQSSATAANSSAMLFAEVASPLILQLYDFYSRARTLSLEGFLEAAELLASYVFRRAV